MNILEVIPLTSFPSQVPQILSYYSKMSLPRGAVVEIVVNRRKTAAVVISSSSVESSKMLLKRSGFQLKKITSIISEEPLVSGIQFDIALWLSRNYLSSLGTSFRTILPSFFLRPKFPFTYPKITSGTGKLPEQTLLTVAAKKTLPTLDSEIKPFLKNKKQVLLLVPETSLAEYYYKYFAGRYETVLMSGKAALKKNYETWNKISSGEVQVVVGTRQALFAPFSSLGLVIIDDPTSGAYKSDMTPKYDTRQLALRVAEVYSARILMVSGVPDLESLYWSSKGSLKVKKISDIKKPPTVVTDMVKEIRTGNFSIFGREFKDEAVKFLKAGKKVLIFSTRKGYSTVLLCENCSFSFKCPKCSVPLRIHTLPEQALVCHRCSESRKMPSSCPNCNSYKIKSAGFAGSEKIKEDVSALLDFAGIKKEIFMFDAASIKNAGEEDALVEKMQDSDSFICIATQSIFSRRAELSFDLVAILNLDSLTTIPDFRAEENLFAGFVKLLDLEPEKMIIQTFSPEGGPAGLLLSGNYKEFYEKELFARRLFMYPPFSRLAKISFRSSDKNRAFNEARILHDKLKIALARSRSGDRIKLLGPSPAFVEKEKNNFIYNIVLKIPQEMRPDEILKYVPSNWSVDVDPRSIL